MTFFTSTEASSGCPSSFNGTGPRPADIMDTLLSTQAPLTRFIISNYLGQQPIVLIIFAVFSGAFGIYVFAENWMQSFIKHRLMSSISVRDDSPLFDDITELVSMNEQFQRCQHVHAQTDLKDDEEDSGKILEPQNDRKTMNFAPRPKLRLVLGLGVTRIRHGGYTIFIHRQRISLMSTSGFPTTSEEFILSCYGWSKEPILNLLKNAMNSSFEEGHRRTRIYHPKRDTRFAQHPWEKRAAIDRRPLHTVVLDCNEKEKVIKDMVEFLQSSTKKYYKSRAIPYKRGYMFYGPPGTGKTSLTVALAGEVSLDIYVIQLSKSSDAELLTLFRALPATCIVLFEDIDTCGIQRDPVSRKNCETNEANNNGAGVTLSGLLNALDGVGSHQGHILVMSTNRPESLDPALVRAGRVDVPIRFTLATREMIKELFLCFYSDAETQDQANVLDHMANEFAEAIPSREFSTADIQEFLLQHKRDPQGAVKAAESWVEAKRKETGGSEEKTQKVLQPETNAGPRSLTDFLFGQ